MGRARGAQHAAGAQRRSGYQPPANAEEHAQRLGAAIPEMRVKFDENGNSIGSFEIGDRDKDRVDDLRNALARGNRSFAFYGADLDSQRELAEQLAAILKVPHVAVDANDAPGPLLRALEGPAVVSVRSRPENAGFQRGLATGVETGSFSVENDSAAIDPDAVVVHEFVPESSDPRLQAAAMSGTVPIGFYDDNSPNASTRQPVTGTTTREDRAELQAALDKALDSSNFGENLSEYLRQTGPAANAPGLRPERTAERVLAALRAGGDDVPASVAAETVATVAQQSFMGDANGWHAARRHLDWLAGDEPVRLSRLAIIDSRLAPAMSDLQNLAAQCYREGKRQREF